MQSQRLMGEGYEPYVEQQGDRLTYSLPVDSGFAMFYVKFVLRHSVLAGLPSSVYRRAVLEITAHTLLQHSTLKGNDRFTQKDFDNLVAVTLHASLALLHIFISRVSREHNIAIDHYVEEILHRRTRRD